MEIYERKEFKETLLQFDDSEKTENSSRFSKWAPWVQGATSLCALGGSIAVRIALNYVATNAAASCVIGFSVLALATAAIPMPLMARARQVAFPIFGQTTLYALSQGYANDQNRGHQIAFINTISSLFGSNLQLSLGMLWERGVIRSESCPQKLDVTHAMKAATAIGLGAISYFFSVDKILQPVTGYFCSFLLAQVLGEYAIDKIDEQISAADKKGVGTRWRTAKTAILTLSYLGQILTFSLLPWKKAEEAQRLLQLRISGGLLGLLDGLLVRSQGRRIEQFAIGELEELAKVPPPKKIWQRNLYRIWKVAVPAITILGLLSFAIQQTKVLKQADPILGIWMTFGGLLAGTGVSHLAERLWDPEKRSFLKDKLMSSIWYSHRFLGVDPIYFYFALINSVKMDSTAVASEKSPYHIAAIIIAWFSYGFCWGHEQFINLSSLIGNAQIKYPKLVMFNAAMTTSYNIIGAS